MKNFLKSFLWVMGLVIFLAFLFLWGCDSIIGGMEIDSRLEHAPPLVFRIDNGIPITLLHQRIREDSRTMYYDYSMGSPNNANRTAISIHITLSPVNYCTSPKTLNFVGCKPEFFNFKDSGEQDRIIFELAQGAADAFLTKHKNDYVSPEDRRTFMPDDQRFQAYYKGANGKGLGFRVLNQGAQHFSLLPSQASLSHGITDASIIIIIPKAMNLGLAYTFTLTSTSPDPAVRALWLSKLTTAVENVEYQDQGYHQLFDQGK
jgi:hypothetical protein